MKIDLKTVLEPEGALDRISGALGWWAIKSGMLPDTAEGIASMRSAYWSRLSRARDTSLADRWLGWVIVLAALDGALFLALQARPGAVGVLLWHLGPASLALLATGVLMAALVASRRRRQTWSRSRAAGYLVLVALVSSLPFYRTYPSSYDASPSRATFRLPLEGRITVAWGGRSPAVNYHVAVPNERWAYDLLVTDQGKSQRGRGDRLEDYYTYDKPVLAPADGLVRAAIDGEPDRPIGGRWRAAPFGGAMGNHVMIEVGSGQFLFVAHLRPRSVSVKPGARVRAGDPIGRVGNSGNSSEPHVHLHLQDSSRLFFAEAIPFYFSNYWYRGRRIVRGMPQGGFEGGRFTGQTIEQAADPEGPEARGRR